MADDQETPATETPATGAVSDDVASGGDAGDDKSTPPSTESDKAPADDVEGSSEEAKPEGGKSEEGAGDGGDEEDKSDGAPEEYAAFEIPESMHVDDERMGKFKDYAKSKNFTQAEAQELLDLHMETVQEAADLQKEKWDEVKNRWRTETESDKDLLDASGSPAEAISIAKNAVDRIGGEELRNALEITGAGNHPAVVKAFFKIGKFASEGRISFGKTGADTRTKAERMYPSMKQKT